MAKIIFYIGRKNSLINPWISFAASPYNPVYTGSSIYVNISACHMDNTACLKKSLIKF